MQRSRMYGRVYGVRTFVSAQRLPDKHRSNRTPQCAMTSSPAAPSPVADVSLDCHSVAEQACAFFMQRENAQILKVARADRLVLVRRSGTQHKAKAVASNNELLKSLVPLLPTMPTRAEARSIFSAIDDVLNLSGSGGGGCAIEWADAEAKLLLQLLRWLLHRVAKTHAGRKPEVAELKSMIVKKGLLRKRAALTDTDERGMDSESSGGAEDGVEGSDADASTPEVVEVVHASTPVRMRGAGQPSSSTSYALPAYPQRRSPPTSQDAWESLRASDEATASLRQLGHGLETDSCRTF